MVDRRHRLGNPSPWLHPHYQASQLLRDGPPLCPATGTQSLPDSADWDAPSRRARLAATPAAFGFWPSVLRATGSTISVQEPKPSSRHLHAGHRLASRQVPARLIPRPQARPGFDVVFKFSTRQQWFTRVRLLGSHLTRSGVPFPQRSPPRLLTDAAYGGLKPPPAERLRRAKPPSPAQTHTQQTDLLHRPPPMFVSHAWAGIK